MDIHKLAVDFAVFFNSNSNLKLSSVFLREFYVFSMSEYISASEFIRWLEITRNGFIERLQKYFKKGIDYFEVDHKDEMKELKLTTPRMYTKKHNQKHYVITSKCFKEYCMRSQTKKGEMVRDYFYKLDEMFKKFHLKCIDGSDKKRQKLLNNQKKKDPRITTKPGIYILGRVDDDIYKIGHSQNIYRRLSQPVNTNSDKISIKIIVYTNAHKNFESLLKMHLEPYLYRGEFYKCSLDHLEKTVNNVVNYMRVHFNHDITSESVVKFFGKNKSLNKMRSKTKSMR